MTPFPSANAQPEVLSSPEVTSRTATLVSPRPMRPRTPGRHSLMRPATPTRARPPPLFRTLSHTGTAAPAVAITSSSALAFAGVGPVPRSARRWARSAHLHEVRGVSRDRGRSAGTKGKGKEGEENAAVHDGLRTAPVHGSAGTQGTYGHVGDGDASAWTGPRKPLTSLRMYAEPATAPLAGAFATNVNQSGKEEEGDVDAWVDTDAGGSDMEDIFGQRTEML
jgi:hypothetical protein